MEMQSVVFSEVCGRIIITPVPDCPLGIDSLQHPRTITMAAYLENTKG